MKIAVAQLQPRVGEFERNRENILKAYERAEASGAHLLLTPEMSLVGYPALDLWMRPEFLSQSVESIEWLRTRVKGKCALLIGHVGGEWPRGLQNEVSVIYQGEVIFTQAKTLLPTYDIYDEARYFRSGARLSLLDLGGLKIGVGICEDFWGHDPNLPGLGYTRDFVSELLDAKPELLLSLSASPYELDKRRRRHRVHSEVARRLGAPLIYTNQVGSVDEVIFDGGSFALSADGEVLHEGLRFQEDFWVMEVPSLQVVHQVPARESALQVLDSWESDLHQALVLGIREYFRATGFRQAVLGLSGGIDSALTAVLLCEALGNENVLGVAMPSQFSSNHSIEDATALAQGLGIRFRVEPIKFSHVQLSKTLGEPYQGLSGIALENLQSRLRGLFLMTLANQESALVVTTGNKSELAAGYCTIYGDMVGAIAPLGDLYKTQVFALSRYLTLQRKAPIPESTLRKPPSAELRPGQTDQDTLPTYENLDRALCGYLEEGRAVEDLIAEVVDPLERDKVRKFFSLFQISEFKRRQAAPVLRVSSKAFGWGRRVPIMGKKF